MTKMLNFCYLEYITTFNHDSDTRLTLSRTPILKKHDLSITYMYQYINISEKVFNHQKPGILFLAF